MGRLLSEAAIGRRDVDKDAAARGQQSGVEAGVGQFIAPVRLPSPPSGSSSSVWSIVPPMLAGAVDEAGQQRPVS